jgi:hypothetical protein
MDISGITQKPMLQPSSTNETLASGKLTNIQPVRKSDVVNQPVNIPKIESVDLKRSDEKRFNEIRRTVERETKSGDFFAVRDTRFTIFKDSVTGQYITRFTSLRDGSVTYVPEPDILRASGRSENYYEVTA